MRFARAGGEMAEHEEPEEWLLLSGCVARELHPVYRSRPGYARRDLEAAILAGRAVLRGRKPGTTRSEVIDWPITTSHRLDIIRNTLAERRPGPFGDNILFHDVEIAWNKIHDYLRAYAAQCWPSDDETVEPLRPNSNVPSVGPKRARTLAKVYIERESRAGRHPTISGLEKWVHDAGYRGGRDNLRAEFHRLQNAAGTPVRRGRVKKSPA